MINLMKYVETKTDIVFDWNGTILNDLELCVNVINEMLGRYGMKTITVSDYKDVFSFPVVDYYVHLGFDFDKIPFHKLSDEFVDTYNRRLSESDLFDGSKELLQSLHSAGKRLSILSAAHEDDIHALLKKYGLDQFFTEVFGLDNTHAFGKAERATKLIEKLDCNAKDIILIGDTNHDFEVAEKVEIDCILLADGHQSYDRLKNLPCTVLKSRY